MSYVEGESIDVGIDNNEWAQSDSDQPAVNNAVGFEREDERH